MADPEADEVAAALRGAEVDALDDIGDDDDDAAVQAILRQIGESSGVGFTPEEESEVARLVGLYVYSGLRGWATSYWLT